MVSSGFRVIIATVIGAGIGAVLFPIKDDTVSDEVKVEASAPPKETEKEKI
jgi:hypothetical protein